jgi:CheY-like chemotaxis protein
MQQPSANSQMRNGPPATASRRILVVDDDRDEVEMLKMLLDTTGNPAQYAYDGLEAVKVAEETRPDLILLDIGMPNLNGYETCRRIREQPWGKEMVIVALTGLGHDDDRLKSQQSGFDMHLVKPVDPKLLLTVLAAAAGVPRVS